MLAVFFKKSKNPQKTARFFTNDGTYHFFSLKLIIIFQKNFFYYKGNIVGSFKIIFFKLLLYLSKSYK